MTSRNSERFMQYILRIQRMQNIYYAETSLAELQRLADTLDMRKGSEFLNYMEKHVHEYCIGRKLPSKKSVRTMYHHAMKCALIGV